MVGSVIKIIVGLFLWQMVPGMLKISNLKAKTFAQLCCNVLGIIVVISGAISLITSLF